jgi:hypothetical protein
LGSDLVATAAYALLEVMYREKLGRDIQTCSKLLFSGIDFILKSTNVVWL